VSIENYRELVVWQKGMDLVVKVYRFTADFPPTETYGLTSQMRRAAVSIPSNTAEGSKRSTRKDYRNFLNKAFGSGAELETQLEVSQRLDFGTDEKRTELEGLLAEIMRMLNRMHQRLDEPALPARTSIPGLPTTVTNAYNLPPTT